MGFLKHQQKSCGNNAGKDAEKSVKMVLQSLGQKTETPNISLFLPKQEETGSDLGDILERPNLEEDSLNSSPTLSLTFWTPTSISVCLGK